VFVSKPEPTVVVLPSRTQEHVLPVAEPEVFEQWTYPVSVDS